MCKCMYDTKYSTTWEDQGKHNAHKNGLDLCGRGSDICIAK